MEWTRERDCIAEGQGFLLLPGHWHRYRPDPDTGWEEDWFELRGSIVDRWVNRGLFNARIFHLEKDSFRRMDALHQLAEDSRRDPGELAGLAMSLLASACSRGANSTATERKTQRHDLVAEARSLLRQGRSVAETARQVGTSYPTLNRTFKELTGLTPKTYARQIRLARAEALLAGGGLTVKEVAAELGYGSAGHFSAEFKRAYGKAPRHWREKLMRERK